MVVVVVVITGEQHDEKKKKKKKRAIPNRSSSSSSFASPSVLPGLSLPSRPVPISFSVRNLLLRAEKSSLVPRPNKNGKDASSSSKPNPEKTNENAHNSKIRQIIIVNAALKGPSKIQHNQQLYATSKTMHAHTCTNC